MTYQVVGVGQSGFHSSWKLNIPYNITKVFALSLNGIEHFDSKGSPPEITIAMFILFVMILFAKSHS